MGHALPLGRASLFCDLTTLLFFCGEHDVLFSATIDTKTGRWCLRNCSRKIMRTSNRRDTFFGRGPEQCEDADAPVLHTDSHRALTTGTLFFFLKRERPRDSGASPGRLGLSGGVRRKNFSFCEIFEAPWFHFDHIGCSPK